MIKNNLILCLVSIPLLLSAQVWNLESEVVLEEEISSVSLDNQDYLYVGLSSGGLIRYLPSGEEDQYYALANNSAITLTETWNRMKVFTFFRDQQRIEILDRFTTTPRSVNLANGEIPYVWLAAPGIDNSLWVLSTSLKELRKYDDQNLNLLFAVPLQDQLAIEKPIFMRAFKNHLLLVDEQSGILFFDQFGSNLGHFAAEGLRYFQIRENRLVFLSGDWVMEVDPETRLETSKLKAPSGAFQSVLIVSGRYAFIGVDRIASYSLR